jgi:hypothetical protein
MSRNERLAWGNGTANGNQVSRSLSASTKAPPPTLKAVAAVIWSSCITAVGYGRAFCVLAFYIYLCFHVLSMKYLLLPDMTLLNMLQNTMLLNMPHDNCPYRLIANPFSSSSLKTPLSSTLSPSPPLHHIGIRIPPASALPRLVPQNPPKHRDFRGSKTQPRLAKSIQVESSRGKARHLIVRPTAPQTPRQNIFRGKKKEKVVEVKEQFVETSRNCLVRVSQFHLPAMIPVVKKLHKNPRSQTATLKVLRAHLPRTYLLPSHCRRCGDKRKLGNQRSAPRV